MYVVALSTIANKVAVLLESEPLYHISVESVASLYALLVLTPFCQVKIIEPFLFVVAAKFVGAGGTGKV